jgi:hypothetical protein
MSALTCWSHFFIGVVLLAREGQAMKFKIRHIFWECIFYYFLFGAERKEKEKKDLWTIGVALCVCSPGAPGRDLHPLSCPSLLLTR